MRCFALVLLTLLLLLLLLLMLLLPLLLNVFRFLFRGYEERAICHRAVVCPWRTRRRFFAHAFFVARAINGRTP